MSSHADTFAEAFQAVSGKIFRAATPADAVDYIRSVINDVQAKCVATALISDDMHEAIAASCQASSVECIGPQYDSDTAISAIDRAQVGITQAQFGIAQSGTLVEVVTDDAHRLVSSLPRTHVGIVKASEMEASLTGAAPRLRKTFDESGGHSVISFISGPSRTGDIEMILTLGVHGPEHAHAIILENE